MPISLLYDDIEDEKIRENFRLTEQYINSFALLRGNFRHMVISTDTDLTNKKVAHNLGFRPLDLIQTSITGTGTLTWNYSQFDGVNLDLTTASTDSTDPLIVRFFVGRYTDKGSV